MRRPRSVEVWRSELIEWLAHRGVAAAWATRNTRIETEWAAFPGQIGVTPDVLDEAARVVRFGFGSLASDGEHKSKTMPLSIMCPTEMVRAVFGMSVEMRLTPINTLRSLLHAAMLRTSEPTLRPGKNWRALPGSEEFRERLESVARKSKAANKKVNPDRHHWTVDISRGLYEALEARAAAFGCRRGRYVLLWVADLVDGRLYDMPLVGVGIGQTFDDPTAYVLPALPSVVTLPSEASE